ncbi:MAG: ABC transporter permease subunit [Polyangiaceae bacterium]|nr:ABC transporter permease subunit [Polyangiaceae bacterium]
MRRSRELVACARLDFGEVLRSRWILSAAMIYGVAAAIFVLVGLRESTVLGFTGMGRVLLSFCHALLVLLPLLALTATAQVINRARDDGTLELLFSHPLSRGGYFVAVSMTRYLSLVLPLLLLIVAMALGAALAFGEAIPWRILGRTLGVSATLLWTFVGAGLAVSTLTRNQTKAIVYALILWALAVALLDFALIGLLLRWRLDARAVFLLAALNPVQAARLALLSGVDPELGAFGPVGFYLATRVGGAALLALGLAWPTLAGVACWSLGLLSFRRGDLV